MALETLVVAARGDAAFTRYPTEAIGNVRELDPAFQTPPVLLELGPRLCNLKELDLRGSSLNEEVAVCVGKQRVCVCGHTRVWPREYF